MINQLKKSHHPVVVPVINKLHVLLAISVVMQNGQLMTYSAMYVVKTYMQENHVLLWWKMMTLCGCVPTVNLHVW